MVKSEKATWLNGAKKSSALIYWRRPADWAQLVYKFVERTGGIGSIFTIYDLLEGDDTIKEGKINSWKLPTNSLIYRVS